METLDITEYFKIMSRMIKVPIEFVEFPKIARLSRECIITEKIDGTCNVVYIGEDGEFLAGSRTRWITPEQDNHGFAKWAYEHKEELITGLGKGRHFGEWWGQGIQRNYGLKEKRFSLFNTVRWAMHGDPLRVISVSDDGIEKRQQYPPECCHIVPILHRGIFDVELENRFVSYLLTQLELYGSVAAPGFMKPEGIVIYHTAGNVAFKKTIFKDDQPKGGKLK